MSSSVQVDPTVERRRGVGRCRCSFWLAVAHDVLGVVLLMAGAFGGLPVHDVFVYGGAIVLFLSLIWWVFWYSGNIDVPPEELQDDVGVAKAPRRRLSRAVRRVSVGIRDSLRRKGRPLEAGPSEGAGPSGMALSSGRGGSSSGELVREALSV